MIHTCNNPSCVNPDHLRQITQKEKSMDESRGKRVCLRCESSDIRVQFWPEYTSDQMDNLTVFNIVIHCNECGFGGGSTLSKIQKPLNTQ